MKKISVSVSYDEEKLSPLSCTLNKRECRLRMS
jgi:hypothetical protein